MHTVELAVHTDDPILPVLGRVVTRMASSGMPVTLREIGDDETAHSRQIAIYTCDDYADWPNRHLRMPPFQVEAELPAWARATPFTVAVKRRSVEATGRSTLPSALQGLIKEYHRWVPGGTRKTPWNVGSPNSDPSDETQKAIADWTMRVSRVYEPNLGDMLSQHLQPIFDDCVGSVAASTERRLVVMGCAPFNDPHTDIAQGLVEEKADRARRYFETLIREAAPWLSEVVFLGVGADFVRHPALKASLHPFFWPSIASLEELLGKRFGPGARICGRTGERTDDEVGEVLEYGFRMMERELVAPLRKQMDFPIEMARWTDLIDVGYFDWAYELTRTDDAIRQIINQIYQDRVEARPWYKTVEDALGSAAGISRTRGNVAVYLATAKWMRDNPAAVSVDTEVDGQFWRELTSPVEEIWGDGMPYIGHVPPAVRQPWGY